MASQSRHGTADRSGLQSVAQVPSWVYQRYSAIWQRAGISAGWALLYLLVDARIAAISNLEGTPLPVEWRIVLAALIFGVGLYKPALAYAGFVVALIYPLYLISIYVMALALAVLVLSVPVVVHHLPLTMMVLYAPVLAPYHLTPVLPLLMGLWATEGPEGRWGRLGGGIAGALCALWLKIVAGMSDNLTDLWLINGWRMDLDMLYIQFHGANSLQTLLRIVEPLTVSNGEVARIVLKHFLQVMAWFGAAYVVSAVRDLLLLRKQGRAGRGSAWTSVLSLVPGLVLIWAGYAAVSSWLQVEGPRWLDPLWLPAQVVLAGVFALGLDGLVRYLQQPILARREQAVAVSVPRKERKKPGRLSRRGREARAHPVPAKPQTVVSRASEQRDSQPPHIIGEESTAPSAGGEKSRNKQGQDIIMIELD
jgi:hypothetical protein